MFTVRIEREIGLEIDEDQELNDDSKWILT